MMKNLNFRFSKCIQICIVSGGFKGTKSIIMKALLLFVITLLAISCREESSSCHFRIVFYNDYDKDVYIISNGIYPDTVYAISYPPGTVSQAHLYKTQSGKSNGNALAVLRRKECFETTYYYDNDTASYYILDAYTWETESAQTIRDNYLVLQRYDLSLEDIRQLGWSLRFPPTEEMRRMKMYPPYGTYNE
jgi:hypothetical protein